MKITIKHKITQTTLFEGEYESLKQCIEAAVRSGANLSGANLYWADLYGANLSGANLYWADLYGANLSRANLSRANLYGANLSGANLSGANLSGANLYWADLYGADLYGANLSGADLYVNSHDFFSEVVRRQKAETITESEWSFVGQLMTHRFCWDTIVTRFGDSVVNLFARLKEAGFGEWADHYETILPKKEAK